MKLNNKTIVSDNLQIDPQLSFKEKPTIKGVLYYTVKKNGEIIETFRDGNMIVNMGLQDICKMIGGDLAGITQIGVGTNGTAPAEGDTALTGAFIKSVDSFSYPSSNSIEYEFTIDSDEANGMAILEFGLLCADDTLFARKVRTTVLNKESDIEINGYWTLTFSRAA